MSQRQASLESLTIPHPGRGIFSCVDSLRDSLPLASPRVVVCWETNMSASECVLLSETLLGKQTCCSAFSWQAWTQTWEDYLDVLSGGRDLVEIVWCSCLHCSALCLVNKPECSCPLLLPWCSHEHTEEGAYSVKVQFYRGKYRRRRGKSPHPPNPSPSTFFPTALL